MKNSKSQVEYDVNSLQKEVIDLRNYLQEITFFLPLAFCKVNSLDYIVGCSQVFQALTGYMEVELIGKPAYFLFKEKGVVENSVIKTLNRKSTIDVEVTLVSKTKNEVPVDVSVLAINDEKGESDGYFLTIKDITKAKEFEEELERRISERTKELESAKEKLQESERILEIKVNARTRQLKETAQNLEEKVKERTKVLEEKTKELQKKADAEEKSRTALLNLAEDLENASQKTQEEKEKTLSIVDNFADGLLFLNNNRKLEIINPQGEEFFGVKASDVVGKNFSEIKNINSNFKAVFDDVTEDLKEIFRQEVQLNEGVFVEITSVPVVYNDETIGTLINIHDITREKNIEKVKTEFVSLAAHQLRTPLAGIKWTLEAVIEEKDDAGIPDEIVDFIKKAAEANNRMVSLVNDLLNVTRIEEGRYVYNPQEVNIEDVVDLALEGRVEELEKKGLKFSLNKPDEELPPIKADEEKLMLVVQNFFDNAMKYTDKGEVSLYIEGLEDNSKIKVSVSDTGVGVPKEHKKKMFNKFTRAENVQRMDTEGSGLGLFISKNIVEAHNGEIGFESEEGEGSTFYFIVPTAK